MDRKSRGFVSTVLFLITFSLLSVVLAGCLQNGGEEQPPAPPGNTSNNSPPPLPGEDTCRLMVTQSNQVGCYGCANGHCTNPPAGAVPYDSSGPGIPYACYATQSGCSLAV